MTKKLLESRPKVIYYLLAFSFPTAFFLFDGLNILSKEWQTNALDSIMKIAVVLFLGGIPIFMILFAKNISIYSDRIELVNNVFRTRRKYYFKDLISWNVVEVNGRGVSLHEILIIKFKNNKLTITQLESNRQNLIIKFLEKNFNSKKT